MFFYREINVYRGGVINEIWMILYLIIVELVVVIYWTCKNLIFYKYFSVLEKMYICEPVNSNLEYAFYTLITLKSMR